MAKCTMRFQSSYKNANVWVLFNITDQTRVAADNSALLRVVEQQPQRLALEVFNG